MDGLRPGAIVGAGLLTIVDRDKILRPQLGKESPLYAAPAEFKESLVVDEDYRRVAEIIYDVLATGTSKMWLGRRSGPAYFSDKASSEVFSAGDLQALAPNHMALVKVSRAKVHEFVGAKPTPIMVTTGTFEARRNVANALNHIYGPTDGEQVFEPLASTTEAFFVVEKIFAWNRPIITGGFQRDSGPEVSTFLVVSAGKSTIHWIVYDDYKHFVPMAKARSVTPWCFKYISMNYDPANEDDKIKIALKTQEAIYAWKALRSR